MLEHEPNNLLDWKSELKPHDMKLTDELIHVFLSHPAILKITTDKKPAARSQKAWAGPMTRSCGGECWVLRRRGRTPKVGKLAKGLPPNGRRQAYVYKIEPEVPDTRVGMGTIEVGKTPVVKYHPSQKFDKIGPLLPVQMVPSMGKEMPQPGSLLQPCGHAKWPEVDDFWSPFVKPGFGAAHKPLSILDMQPDADGVM